MKKLLLLFILITLTISCESKSDELMPVPEDKVITDPTPVNPTPVTPGDEIDSIIGTWKLIQENNQAITDTCEKKDMYTFNEDASYTFDDYNTKSGSCAKDEAESFKGTWKNNDNNTYNIRIHGYTGNGADYNIDFSDDKQELTFLSNGLTYKRQ